jgi:transcriptional regulator GlxA family with amidase domain
MHTVAVALHDSVRVFDYAVIAEVWGIDRTDAGVPPFTLLTCASGRRSVPGGYGTSIRASHPLSALAGADLVVVPGSDVPPRPTAPALLRALRQAHERGTPVAALCAGAFILAEAGLLDGRRAITHWLLAAEFRARFPAVRLEEGGLFVHDSGVWTSAGTAAGIDLCLELVRRAHGAEVAARVARRMVTPPHRSGGQAQYLARPTPTEHGPDLGDLLGWARRHLDQPLTVAQLAARAGMSPRHFARRFTEATGATPLRWLHHQRILAAQELLEGSALPVEQIARRCGFGSTAAFRQQFGRVLGTTPQAYRITFRGASQPAGSSGTGQDGSGVNSTHAPSNGG